MTRDTFDMFNPPERGRFGDNESSSKSPRRPAEICLDFVLHAETNKAILISPDGREANAAWIPKSPRVEIFRGSLSTGATRRSGQRVVLPVVTVSMPEGLARQKGLI